MINAAFTFAPIFQATRLPAYFYSEAARKNRITPIRGGNITHHICVICTEPFLTFDRHQTRCLLHRMD